MVKEFKYTKLVDPSKLHKAIAAAGLNILGIVFDASKNLCTVMLDDTEIRDPTSIINSYVYVTPVYPNYPVLYANAQQSVQGALTQYNTAVVNYTNALSAYNSASTTATKLTAAENQIQACASALVASKDAITALVQVVTVLAENNNVVDQEE